MVHARVAPTSKSLKELSGIQKLFFCGFFASSLGGFSGVSFGSISILHCIEVRGAQVLYWALVNVVLMSKLPTAAVMSYPRVTCFNSIECSSLVTCLIGFSYVYCVIVTANTCSPLSITLSSPLGEALMWTRWTHCGQPTLILNNKWSCRAASLRKSAKLSLRIVDTAFAEVCPSFPSSRLAVCPATRSYGFARLQYVY